MHLLRTGFLVIPNTWCKGWITFQTSLPHARPVSHTNRFQWDQASESYIQFTMSFLILPQSWWWCTLSLAMLYTHILYTTGLSQHGYWDTYAAGRVPQKCGWLANRCYKMVKWAKKPTLHNCCRLYQEYLCYQCSKFEEERTMRKIIPVEGRNTGWTWRCSGKQ